MKSEVENLPIATRCNSLSKTVEVELSVIIFHFIKSVLAVCLAALTTNHTDEVADYLAEPSVPARWLQTGGDPDSEKSNSDSGFNIAFPLH